MKLNKLALTLTAAALLPTLAYAATDEVAASFDRSLYREPFNSAVVTARAADPLDAINVAFRYVEPNAVLASFQRDLYREGANAAALPIKYDDPLRAINIALWKDIGNKPAVHAAIVGKPRHGG